MISKAYIHHYGNNIIEPEHLGVKEVLESKGIECKLFTTKELNRNQLILNPQTLVVGDNPTMMTVFRRLKIYLNSNSYPECLRKYLNRKIWESSIRKIFVESENSLFIPVFVKPKSKPKLFTGFVINSPPDLYQLIGISKATDLYCSTVVNWRSEYRVFVINSKIVGIKNYTGDIGIKLNMAVIENAIHDFEKSDQRTAAYGIDFGVLDNGETALIEWNDGFALGSYGLEKEVYTRLIITRWEEINRKTSF